MLKIIFQIWFIFVFMMINSACTSEKLISYAATANEIQITGRHLIKNSNEVHFAASGVHFDFTVEGETAIVEFSNAAKSNEQYNWFQVVVDGEPKLRFRTFEDKREYTLASNLGKGKHHIRLIHETEGQQGLVGIKQFKAKKIIKSKQENRALIEFIGDSITCGFGSNDELIPCGTGTWFDQHSASRSYGYLLTEKLNADVMLSSVSGMGISRNWNTDGPTMNSTYSSVSIDPSNVNDQWDFSKHADLVVIALGTNDFSDGDNPEKPRPLPNEEKFKEEYTKLILTAKSNYPNATFLLTDSPLLQDSKKAMLNTWLKDIAEKVTKTSNCAIVLFEYKGHYPSGCSSHPSELEHEKMLEELLPTMKKLLK